MHTFLSAPSIQYFLVTLTSIFFLVDPFAAIPAFLVITADAGQGEHRRLARKAALTCFIVLSAFALAGSLIFRLFGITLPAFEIAGGIILILMGLEMLQARRSATHETPGETAEGASKEDAGIIPLGIPMLAGPGAISTVMVLMGPSPTWWQIGTYSRAALGWASCFPKLSEILSGRPSKTYFSLVRQPAMIVFQRGICRYGPTIEIDSSMEFQAMKDEVSKLPMTLVERISILRPENVWPMPKG